MLGDGKSGKREKENDGGVGRGIPPSLSNEGKQIERTEHGVVVESVTTVSFVTWE